MSKSLAVFGFSVFLIGCPESDTVGYSSVDVSAEVFAPPSFDTLQTNEATIEEPDASFLDLTDAVDSVLVDTPADLVDVVLVDVMPDLIDEESELAGETLFDVVDVAVDIVTIIDAPFDVVGVLPDGVLEVSTPFDTAQPDTVQFDTAQNETQDFVDAIFLDQVLTVDVVVGLDTISNDAVTLIVPPEKMVVSTDGTYIIVAGIKDYPNIDLAKFWTDPGEQDENWDFYPVLEVLADVKVDGVYFAIPEPLAYKYFSLGSTTIENSWLLIDPDKEFPKLGEGVEYYCKEIKGCSLLIFARKEF